MGYSSDAMRACYDEIEKATPSAQLSGIYTNKPGYHNCRSVLPSSDYSVQRSWDKKGDADAGGAIDITLSDADIKKFTQRLIDETKKSSDNGPLRALNEFFGTVNGYDVTGMDVPGQYWITSDDSHLWHNHLSGKREFANDKAAWLDVADVMLGRTPGSGGGDDDMPKQLYLYNKTGQVTTLAKAGTWYCVGWNADLAETGGSSLVLPSKITLFDMSAWLYISGLSPDDNIYWRIQTLDRSGNEFAKFPVGEVRATSGDSDLQFGQIGSVNGGKDTNLRLLVAATADNVKINSAWWRTLVW